MRSKSTDILLFLLLGTTCVAMATVMHARLLQSPNRRDDSAGLLKVVLGDGRRMFADHFFEKADIYFHSGYYPSIFDRKNAPKDSRHMTDSHEDHADHETEGGHGDTADAHLTTKSETHEAEQEDHESEHERQMAFLGQPRDWIEAFGRNFIINSHTHLEQGKEREMLPWLRLSAELDPQRIDTYTVAAYWLRVRLGKVKEAEQFLREGLKANPDSYEILFELGRLHYDNYKDHVRARNLWEIALQKWQKTQGKEQEPDLVALERIAANLAHVEEGEGNLQQAIKYFELAKKVSRVPEPLQKQIDELKQKLTASGTSG